ncbi:hypothetical protein AVEN_205932-1 [Araneus ventricosus]|uniref:Uncharacterized protein n=1 Tax=Araneus ventricosus TaxID=182803 RepID=A0A4Y2S4I5_ARAVE|nr:hypothetical protein AVEN_200716-1 [Araneus ventricosus]GBN82615.1 hypothetical protein AVEN_135932-1 [Araneus ventricosus]GBN83097.1 hypothetical protein AVEN_800-1 [Araneus ventricosus]GBN83104.1 hypothetical protein AVEN_205932-1 [Araneus ventricosus]
MKGKAYMGLRRADPKTTKRIVQDISREERRIAPSCNSRKCQERGCDTISEQERKNLSEEFWITLSWDLKICLYAAPWILKALNERP